MVHRATLLRDFDTLQPGWKAFRHILLEKTFAPDAAMVSLHRDRTSTEMWQHVWRNRFVIGCEFTLGDPILGEQQLFRMRDHEVYRTTSRGSLSSRIPRKRPCRNFPWIVHSMKATRTTISGRTQCARTRGSPAPLVKGHWAISIQSRRARNPTSSFMSKPVPTLPAKTKPSPSK